MLSPGLKSFAFIAAAAAAAVGAYASRGMPLVSMLLALLCAALVGGAWRAARRRADSLHDPAISTLVFPPESKFRQSVLPRR